MARDWQDVVAEHGRNHMNSALGETVTVNGTDMRGQFRSDYERLTVDPSTGMQVSDRQPMVSVRAEDVAERPRHGWPVVARGVNYAVMDAEPNSDGEWELFLEFADDNEDGDTDIPAVTP